MSRYPTFKHWIFRDKKPLFVEGDNILTGDVNTWSKTDGQPAILQNSPTGWKGIVLKYSRQNKYFGLFLDFTVPLSFVNDGAKIIRDALWGATFEATLQYGISKFNPEVFPPKYDPYYVGEVDLSKYRQTDDGIDVTVVQGGPAKYLKANEGTTYEIPCDEIDVYLDGFPFTNKIEYTGYEMVYSSILDDQHYYLGLGVVVQEGSSQGILIGDQNKDVTKPYGTTEFLVHSVSKKVDINVEGNIRLKVLADGNIKFQYRQMNEGSDVLTTFYNQSHNNGDIVEIPANTVKNLVQGDKLAIITEVEGNSGFAILPGTTIKLSYDVSFTPTIHKALRVNTLAEKLVEKMTEGKYSFSSTFLKAMENLVYMPATSIRLIPDPVIKISWNDFYKSLAQKSVMLGTRNDQIIIEHLSKAFDQNIIADLGVVANFEISLAEELVYNSVKAGYANQTYDNVNGRDEFNVTQGWGTPIVKVIKELDLTSPVRADMYGVELTRLQLFGQDTTDSKSDNDTFMLDVEKGSDIVYYDGPFSVTDGGILHVPAVLGNMNGKTLMSDTLGSLPIINTSYLIAGVTSLTVDGGTTNGDYDEALNYTDGEVYKLRRPAFDSITGLLHPEGAFNTELSPKYALLNNGSLLHSFLEDESWILKFLTGDKNSDLDRTLNNFRVAEKEDIPVSILPAPYYLPHFFEFDTEVPINFKNIIAKNPYGVIKFKDRRLRDFYGFLWDGDVKPATNDRQKWKLLCSPLTDKNNLK